MEPSTNTSKSLVFFAFLEEVKRDRVMDLLWDVIGFG